METELIKLQNTLHIMETIINNLCKKAMIICNFISLISLISLRDETML